MAKVLAVGIATVDIINLVDEYPQQDQEVRALQQIRQRGGNATNSLVVLSQLGHQCSWAGVLVNHEDGRWIQQCLVDFGIDCDGCERVASGQMPTSYICLSRANGSRTIVHYRDVPEYSFEAFCRVDVDHFDWLHFEGRNIEATLKMVQKLRRDQPHIPVSIEIEKPREHIEQLFPYADLLLFSKSYAAHVKATQGALFLHTMRAQAPQADLVCAWGEIGAYGLARTGQEIFIPVPPVGEVIDTLGAGDTLNAGVIDVLCAGGPLSQALAQGVALATHKCTQYGLNGLRGRGE